MGSLYFGIPLVLMPPQAFLLHPEQWLRSMDRFGATLSAAPNFAYELCLHRVEDKALDELDLHRLRLCFCGAEPVFPDTLERFTARFARTGLSPGALLPVYGLAENSLGLTFPPVGRGMGVLRVEQDRFLRDGEVVATDDPAMPSLRFVSCGVPLPGHEVRIVDDYGHELPEGRQGRIQFRGPCATAGYYRQPQLTRDLFHGAWLDTGDLGFVRQGELYLTGRAKDLVIRAGQHLHPQVIEQAVGEVPGIRRGRVAAFGTQRQGTERLVVVAETRVTDALQRQGVQRAVNAAVQACAGAPADEVVLAAPGAILKTSSGKLRRSACRAAFEGGHVDTPDRWRLLAVVARSQWDRLRRLERHAGLLAYAGYAWLLLGLAALPLLVWLALPLPLAARWWAARRLLGMVATATGIRLQVGMAEALPEEPCIFVSNHASYADALALVCALPRPVAFVAKQELATLPLVGWMLRRLGAVFVARSDPHTHAQALQRVSHGTGDVLFFPEGTFRSMPGLVHFRLGAFVAAAEAGMPVIPVALRGTRAVLRDDEWLPHPGAIVVTFAAAIHPRTTTDAWTEALWLAAEARKPILEHCGEPDAGGERPDMPDARGR
ncbi:MAG TPA: 1-acyl-sn-glycerol-3-phosphate acyltransferase [Frateuria sp.]|nr:1-acyl-sn-glycerol-3-phosphate acyltransferase [Frateuria sp.]